MRRGTLLLLLIIVLLAVGAAFVVFWPHSDSGKTWRKRPIFGENRAGTISQFWFSSRSDGALLIDRSQSGSESRYELYESMTGGESWMLREVNDSRYGLSGSVWTNDLKRALRVSRQIESGVLSINSHSSVHVEAPFGGFKQSGLGRDLGMSAMEGYTELKNIYVAE
jgi:hypothetical protein